MTNKYIVNEIGEPAAEPDVIKWGRWFETHQRHVGLTEIAGIRISTVFLGLDYSFGSGHPLLWETIIFGGRFDGEQDRYSSLEDAIRGHDTMVGEVTRDNLPTVSYRDMR